MRIEHALTLLALGLGGPGCNAPEPDAAGAPAPGPAVSFDGWHRALDRTTGVKLVLPAGYHLRGDHYPPNLPPQKMTDRLTVVGPDGELLEVQQWRNVEGLGLDDWFERYLGSLRAAEPILARGSAAAQGVAAVFLELPGSPQSARLRMAVFALGDRVFRVVCLDADDERASLIFERTLEGFDVEARP